MEKYYSYPCTRHDQEKQGHGFEFAVERYEQAHDGFCGPFVRYNTTLFMKTFRSAEDILKRKRRTQTIHTAKQPFISRFL